MKADFVDAFLNRVDQFIDDTLKMASEGFGQVISGSGTVVTESKKLPAFANLRLSVPSQVRLIRDSVSKVVVTTDNNLIDSISAEVVDGTLEITRTDSIIVQATKTNIDIHTSQVDKIEVVGSSKVSSNDTWSGSSLTLQVNGSGRIELSGQSNDLEVKVNGSGKVRAKQLTTQRANVLVKGSGSVKVNVESELAATVKGSGTISFTGNPKLDSQIKGSGQIFKSE